MKCTRCSSYKNEYSINCVPYSGNNNADYYFLGEMAGRHEAMASQKKPSHFIGASGSNFDALLEMAGINRKDVAIANSHRCYKANNKKPTKSELDKCFIHTLREVNKIKPKLIIAMGEVALYQTLGKSNISKHRGKVYYSKKLNCNVYVVYHPASILYNSSHKDILIKDFKNIKHAGDPFQYYKADYTLIKSINEYEKIKNKLINSKIIYLDTETTGLDPWKDNITLIQLGTDNKKIYLFDSSILYDIDFSFLETKPIVGAGFEFDAKMLFTNLDLSLDNYYHDVILAEYLLTGVGNNDLDELTDKYVPECSGYSEEAKNSGGAQNLSGEELYQYAANDIYVMYKIVEEQTIELEKENLTWLFKKVKMPTNKILTNMSILGVKYDVDKIKEVDKKYKKKGEDLLAIAKNLDGVEACQNYFKRIFNPRSSQQIKWLLLDYYKLPVLKTTKKTGNPSVGQKEMEIYAKKYNNKYCQTMVDYRSIQTLRSSFLKGVLPKLNDGIAHTKYSLHSTATGRPNSTGINLLNIPRNKDVKQCLIARDGYSFVYGDEAQMEVRVASVVYNEPRLISICNDETKDMHCAITAQAFNRNYDEIYNGYKEEDKEITELRRRGKCVPETTRILTTDGYIQIKDFIPNNIKEGESFQYCGDTKVASLNAINKIIAVYRGYDKRTLTIESSDGYVVTTSEDHLIRTINNGVIEWKKAKDLLLTDFIAVSCNSNIYGSTFCIPTIEKKFRGTSYIPWYPDEYGNMDIAAFIGLMIAEGNMTKGSVQVAVTTKDREFIKHINLLFHRLFKDRSISVSFHKDDKYADVIKWAITSIDCTNWFKLLKLNVTSKYKSIPDCVFMWPKKYQAELLRWYFEGDGTIKKNGNGYDICVSTKSYKLAKDLMLLLANFGITTKLSREGRTNYPDTYYVVSIKTNKSRENFKKSIGFITKRKNKRFLISNSAFSKDYNIIPNCKNLLIDIEPYINGGIGRNKLRECLRKKGAIRLNESRLKQILKNLDSSYYKNNKAKKAVDTFNFLLSCNVSWQKVSSITYNNDKVKLYDISVPYPHEVVYDGIVCHQSVMFGILYQQQAEGLAYNINVKKQEAQQFIDDFYSGFPDLSYYIEETKKEVVKNGYLVNYFGFKRCWSKHSVDDHNTQREAVNLLIQSCSWNLLEIAMIKIDKILTKRRLKARLLMQVYDAIICESIDEEIDEVAHIMKKVMTSVNKSFDVLNRVKLLTDIEVGKNLSDMKKYKGAINE